MAHDSEKARLDRDEWKTWEAQYKEIPVSQLRMRSPGDGERIDGKTYLESIPDNRIEPTPFSEREKTGFFDVFSGVEESTGVSDNLKSLIEKIAAKEGCLTPTRWKVLTLWLMGKTKRDITKILYPERSSDINKGNAGTVGVEVYVQRMLNHFIPMSIRFFVEANYPHIVWKYLKYYPLHPKFIKRAWVESVRKEGDTIDNFLALYSENPAAVLMLRKLLVDESKTSIMRIDNQFYLKPNLIHDIVSKMLGRMACQPDFNYQSVRSTFFDNTRDIRCRGAALYLYLYLSVRSQHDQN